MSKRSIFVKIIAVGLIACMAFINPLQTLSQNIGSVDVVTGLPTESKAAIKDGYYIRDVRLAIDKDPEKAKQILEDDGYEVVDQDLNEDAGTVWNDMGDQAVYMGFKRTKNPDQAIREMKTMNMLGKYNFTILEQRIEEHKAEAKKIYDKLKVALAEFKENYKNGDLAAKICYQNLQKIREDDSGMLMGDLFLSDISEEDLLRVLLEGNTYLRASVIQSLSIGVDEENDNGKIWIDRVSKATSYKDVLKQYSRAIYNKDSVTGDELEHVKKIASDELDDAAKTMLSHWDEIKETISGGKEVEEIILDFEEDLDGEESENLIFDTCNTAMAECLKTVKYGKKTLYHFFQVSKKTFEDDITKLYPLVYAFSPGQRSILDMIDPADLIQGAIIRKNDEYAESDLSGVEKTIENNLDELDVMSIYSGVDRSMYQEGAAMTSEAILNMSSGEDDYNRWDDFDNALALMFTMGSATFCLMGLYFLKAVPTYTDASNVSQELQDCFEAYWGFKYDTAKDLLTTEQIEAVVKFEEEHGTKVVNTELMEGYRIVGKVMIALSVVLAGLAIFEYYKVKKKENNVKQLPIPQSIVDFNVENEAGKYLTYNVVKWNLMRDEPDKKDFGRGDRADLNGDGGKQWLALYTSKDKVLGDPIIADSIIAKTGEKGGRDNPGTSFVPLTMFGNSSIQNLVDEEYSYNDSVDGIWMWYAKGSEGSAAMKEIYEKDLHTLDDEDVQSIEEDAGEETAEEEDGSDAVSGDAVDTTGSNIGGGSIAIIVSAVALVGFIIGMICMFYIRKKRTVTSGDRKDDTNRQ